MSANGGGRKPGIAIPGKEALRAPRPRRFYATACHGPAADGGYEVLLDGRAVRTPGKRKLTVPTAALAEAIAAEWGRQGKEIDPASMPLTRLVNTVIDAVVREMDAVGADIVSFAGSDLLCYRAEHPRELVASQRAAWDPVLAWAIAEHGIRLDVVSGVMPIAQPAAALARVGAAVARVGDPYRLASLHVITTLTGSALLALAHDAGRLTPDEVWQAAHVDEDFQIAQWGVDAEAAERRGKRRAELDAAVLMARLAGGG